MILKDNYYLFRQITSGITLCLIHIPGFIERYIPGIDPETYVKKRAIVFGLEGSLDRFFVHGEFNTINRFKVLKKQIEWMAGKVAVKKLTAWAFQVDESSVAVSAEPSGAPFLPDYPDISISISHSGDYAAACLGKGNIVALDIEKIEHGRMKNITRVAFSERERAAFGQAAEETLYVNWTVKEAFLKYIKKGFAEGLKNVEILDGKVVHNNATVQGITILPEILEENYAFTLIYRND